MARDDATIIRKARRGAPPPVAHHGGAWKVAYADFVTAMMAFFLLMWLLNATTEQQRKGLADYFAPDVPIARVSGGGDGMFGGDSLTDLDTQVGGGRAASPGLFGTAAFLRDQGAEGTAPDDGAALAAAEAMLMGAGGESLLSDEALRHVVTRLTDEGLVIEVFALPGAPIFADEAPTPVTREILAAVARTAARVTNDVAVGAHLARRPVVLRDNPVWDLSAARAATTRHLLEEAGLDPARLARLTGHGDRTPAVADAAAPRNDRIEVVLLRRGRR